MEAEFEEFQKELVIQFEEVGCSIAQAMLLAAFEPTFENLTDIFSALNSAESEITRIHTNVWNFAETHGASPTPRATKQDLANILKLFTHSTEWDAGDCGARKVLVKEIGQKVVNIMKIIGFYG